jgi:predicted Zn-dependent protease
MAARRQQLAVAVAACLVACVQDDGSRFNPIEAVVPAWDEDSQSEAGMQYDRELQTKVAVIHDPIVAGFVNQLGQEIVQTIEPQPFAYRFRVIADPSLNAFALPGGYVYLHSGTLLAATSVDELAGVIGHEIAHVKARHHFRMAQRAQLPNILAGLVGMGAAIATGEGGALVAAQAVNVAVQLRFSREFETEADELGGIFVTRAGFEADGSARFFERILEEQKGHPDTIPPYLYSHPAVEERIASVRQAAQKLRPAREPDPALAESLTAVQARLAHLLDAHRTSFAADAPPPDRAITDPLLAEAERLAQAGDVDAALLVLARAEAQEPRDPRVPFRIGELLADGGRAADAAAAFGRALQLDPSRALVFFKLGIAYQQLGQRQRAVYAFEQAMRRAGEGSVLQRRAAWEVEKLSFSIVREAGFADGDPEEKADTPVGFGRERFAERDRRMVWWARLGPHFVPYADRLRVRWIDPDGELRQDAKVAQLRKPFVSSTLERGERGFAAGLWRAETLLDDAVIDTRTVPVGP